MSTDRNKAVVMGFFDAASRGDMDAAFALIADDVTWTNIGSTRFSGSYVGKQAIIEELIGPLFGQLKAGITPNIERLIAEGDTVVVLSTGSAETHDGARYDNTYCQVMRIRDGQIAEVTEYFDTALVDAVFGAR